MGAAQIWHRIAEKLAWTSREIDAGIPYISVGGVYRDKGQDDIAWWTNGFYAGILWMLYEQTGDAFYRTKAETIEQRLDEVLYGFDGLHHDVGFLWMPTAVRNYTLTGNETSRQRAMLAASVLASRFRLSGGFIRAWNGKDNRARAIIDCMMNIPLLYWASEQCGDDRFAQIARAHADTTLRAFVRGDGSVHHIVDFDPETGEVADTPRGQGYAPGSSWSRGQAWAIYGFAQSYEATREQRYLDAAKRVAHYYLSQTAEDSLPKCDFRQPSTPILWDATAGAIAAGGLLRLARCAQGAESAGYYRAAKRIVQDYDARICDWSRKEQGIVRMGTGAYHHSDSVHVPIIYGDYYFIETVLELKRWEETQA